MADPGRKRPVSWSLHKYFSPARQRAIPLQDGSPGPSPVQDGSPGHSLVATQPVPKPRSWLQQQLAERAALEKAASEAAQLQPEGGTFVQVVPAVAKRQWAGGRTKKAPGAPKSSYRGLTGR